MAASRNMALLGLLMACAVCGFASAAGTVAPVETMKLGGGLGVPDLNLLDIHIRLKFFLVGFLPTEVVNVLVTGAGVQVVSYTFEDGVESVEKTISVAVCVTAPAPLKVKVTIGAHEKVVTVPLVALGAALVDIGEVTGIVPGMLLLSKTTAGEVFFRNPATDYVSSVFGNITP